MNTEAIKESAKKFESQLKRHPLSCYDLQKVLTEFGEELVKPYEQQLLSKKEEIKSMCNLAHKLIAQYEQKINECTKDIERFTTIKNQIKQKHSGCPTKYECDFDYQQMKKDITQCNAQMVAYQQAKADIDSMLDLIK